MKSFWLAFLCLVAALPTAAMVGGGDIRFKVKYVGDVVFHHDTHAEAGKFDCKDCHPGIFSDEGTPKKTTMRQMRAKQGCGVCHNGKNAFSVEGTCYLCHEK